MCTRYLFSIQHNAPQGLTSVSQEPTVLFSKDARFPGNLTLKPGPKAQPRPPEPAPWVPLGSSLPACAIHSPKQAAQPGTGTAGSPAGALTARCRTAVGMALPREQLGPRAAMCKL